MVPAPRVFQFSCKRYVNLFRANTLLPRSLRSTAGSQWSYMIAQPSLVTSARSGLACTTSLSSLMATKPWYDPEEDGLMEHEFTSLGALLSLRDTCQWAIFNLLRRRATHKTDDIMWCRVMSYLHHYELQEVDIKIKQLFIELVLSHFLLLTSCYNWENYQ
jgi:hypothetical protein